MARTKSELHTEEFLFDLKFESCSRFPINYGSFPGLRAAKALAGFTISRKAASVVVTKSNVSLIDLDDGPAK